MSAIRDPAYITNAGRTMMTAGGDISYTKAILYGQDISHLDKPQIEALTTIGNPLREVKVGISDKQNTDNQTTVVLESTFQNSNLKADLPYSAVGFFAKKGNDEEKLVLVAVANSGSYLSATRPDGIATDALDLKVAITIGDATHVTAVVDPSGSVTPSTLNGAINKVTHDLTAQIQTKADKQVVDDEISKIDFTPYAKTADVDKKLDTKVDKTTLKDYPTIDKANQLIEIANSDKANKSEVEAEIKKVTDLANSKVDATYSYSKDELDKKLLALSTDTDGKVDANQVADMITDKANASDVYSKKDVDELLKTKDDASDVDKKIKAIDFSKIGIEETYLNSNINVVSRTIYPTKQADGTWIFDRDIDDATSEAAQEAINEVSKIDSQITDLKGGKLNFTKASEGYDLLSNDGTWGIIEFENLKNIKNLPSNLGNKNWLYALKLIKDNGWGSVTIFSQDNTIYQNVKNGPSWTGWRRALHSDDLANLQNQINANKPDWNKVTNKPKYRYSLFNGNIHYNKSNGKFEWFTKNYFSNEVSDSGTMAIDLDDDQALRDTADALTDVKNHANNALPKSGGGMNLRSTINWTGGGIDAKTGNLGGLYWSGGTDNAKIYADQNGNDNLDLVFDLGDDGSNHFSFRNKSSEVAAIRSNGHFTGTVDWSRVNGRPDVATKSDVQSLLNKLNQQSQQIQSLTTQLNNANNEIKYIKQNYVEGKRFASNQEAQAKAWENQNPQRVAFISD